MQDEITEGVPGLRRRPVLGSVPPWLAAALVALVGLAAFAAMAAFADPAGRPAIALLLGAFACAIGLALWREWSLANLQSTLEAGQRRMGELDRRLAELAALHEAARAGILASGVEDALEAVVRAALGLTGGQRGDVALLRGSDELLTVAAVGGERGLRRRVGEGLEGRVAGSGRADIAGGEGPDAPGAVALPVGEVGAVVGVMSLETAPGAVPDGRDLEVLGLLARRAAEIIAAAQRRESLQLQATQRLYHSQHDALTNLPTRDLFLHNLEELLLAGRTVAVLLLDLDQFRRVNESLGHAAGDAVLVEVARRLTDALPEDGVVARLGSDQFAVAQPEVPDLETMAAAAARVRGAFALPMRCEGREITLRTRLGAALAGLHGRTAEELVRNADTALHVAKEHPEAEVVVFERSMRREAMWRMDLESGLRAALEEGQLELRYQPIVELASGDIVGYEALLRWEHPELGIIPPTAWVGAAEESDLCGRLDLWVLERACSATARIAGQLGRAQPLHGHVNISPGSLAIAGFAESVREILERVGLPPEQVVLEITERALVSDIATVHDNVAGVRALGVRLALDDFGTGYSALGYLRRFPVDGVKIDRMFIDAVVGDADARELVRGIVRLSEGLGLDVVAEGIERQDQLAVLRELGCRYGQGWLFSRSLSEDDFASVALAGTDTLLLRGPDDDPPASSSAAGA